MKIAVISVTNAGARLSEKIAQSLNHVDIYAKAGRNLLKYKNEYHSLSELICKIFRQYDGLVFIMATGIVVRVIAPFIQDKRSDPAVVVVDETGNYAISLLSGHIGGANDLARMIAESIQAIPIITTATDVNNKPAADVLAVKLGLKIELFDMIKKINAALVNGDAVCFFLDSALQSWDYSNKAAELGIELHELNTMTAINHDDPVVVITDKLLDVKPNQLLLRPPTLAVGIGCRRGTTKQEILDAIHTACTMIKKSINSIAVISSTVVKQDELGLLEAVQALNVPVKFFNHEDIADTINQNNLKVSSFVNEKIGVGNVCEAAALLASQSNKILLPKTKFSKITIAITEVKLP